MSETVINWTTVLTAIQTELEGVTNSSGGTAFLDVIPGKPLGLPLGGPYACFWYEGRMPSREGETSLGNVMYAARIPIQCFWVRQAERATLLALEADIATIDTGIRRAFRANSTINSNLTDLTITDSERDSGMFAGSQNQTIYESIAFELRLDNLEGEAIAP